jgi:hypothetical protein
MDPFALDWGPATAEFENAEAKTACHIFAFDLSSPAAADRALRFAAARLDWCARKLPAGTAQSAWFDDREKPAPSDVKARAKDLLASRASEIMFMSDGGEEG